MKRYFDRNNKLLAVGDVVHFSRYGEDRIGRITSFKTNSGAFQNYDSAYITGLDGLKPSHRLGLWEATCVLAKVPDEELMLMMLENF